MRRAAAIVLPLLVAVQAIGVRAQDMPVYDVEVVVFRHVRPLLSSEQWSAQTLAANLDGALDLSQPEAFPDLQETVTASEPQRLREHVVELAGLTDFEVLLHKAWQQPGFESDAALAVRLNAVPLEQPIVEQPSAAWTPPSSASHGGFDSAPTGGAPQFPQQQPAALQQPTGEQPPQARQQPVGTRQLAEQPQAVAAAVTDADLSAASTLITHALDGTLTLVRSRFLHVYTDLIYTIPSASLPHAIRHQLLRKAAQPMNETMEVGSGAFGREPQLLTMQSYPVRYHRRMRSSELHYIDHPLVGILILVTPVEVDASELTE